MTVTVVRPNATPTGSGNVTITGGAGSVHAALSDDSDTTYITKSVTGSGSVGVAFGTMTLSSSVRVKQVRIRSKVLCPTAASRLRVTPICRIDGVNYTGAAQTFSGEYVLGEYAGAYFTTAPDGSAWDQDRIDGLRAQIADLATGADLSNVYELFFDIETTARPTVTVSNPAGTITLTSKPECSWAYTDTDGSDQDYHWVRVFTDAQYLASGFDPGTSDATWESGEVASGDNTITIDEHLLDDTYRAYVKVAKTVSGTPFYSAWAYSGFIVNTTPPTVPTVVTTFDSANNRVEITATGASVSGSFDSQVFQIQRSDDAGVTWADVVGGTAVVIGASAATVLYDYAAPRAATAYHRARAIGTLGEDEVASAWSSSDTIAVTNDGTWWIKAVTDPDLNAGGLIVPGGFGGTAVEQVGVFRPLGRAGAVVVSAGMQTEDGQLTVKAIGLTDFDEAWALAIHRGTLLIQSPEPRQRLVRVTSRSYTRTGRMSQSVNDITIEYVGVDE